MGYEAEGAAVLVRAGESVNVAVQAVRVGGAVWLSAGTYTESVRVTKPCRSGLSLSLCLCHWCVCFFSFSFFWR